MTSLDTSLHDAFVSAYPEEADIIVMTADRLRAMAPGPLANAGYTKVGNNLFTHANCPALLLTPAFEDWRSMYGYVIVQDRGNGHGFIARAGNGARSAEGPTFPLIKGAGRTELGCSEPYPAIYDPDTQSYREYYDCYESVLPVVGLSDVPVARSMSGVLRVWQLLCTADSLVAHSGVFAAGVSTYGVGHSYFPSSATAALQLPTAVGKLIRTEGFKQAALQQYSGKLSAIADAAYHNTLERYPESLLTVDPVHLIIDCSTGSVHGQSVSATTSYPPVNAFGLSKTSFSKTPGPVTPGGSRKTKPPSALAEVRIRGVDNTSDVTISISPNPSLWFSHSGVCRNALVHDIDQVYTCWDLVSRVFPMSSVARTPETGSAWDMVRQYHLAEDGDINLYDFDTSALSSSVRSATTAIDSANESAASGQPLFIDSHGDYTTVDTGKPAGPINLLGGKVFGAVNSAVVPASGPSGAVLSDAVEACHRFIADLEQEIHAQAKKQ